MIIIKAERCNGCGACLEVCPKGAIYLVDGRAALDGALCRSCTACIAVCPTEAIVLAEQVRKTKEELVRIPALQPAPEIIKVKTRGAPTPLRATTLPIVGAALTWAGRKLIPRLAEYFLQDLDRRVAEKQARGVGQDRAEDDCQTRRGGGRRRRCRRGS